MSVRRAHGHKYTGYCPIKKCNYTSKIPVIEGGSLNNANSVHSTMCPKHRELLVRKKINKSLEIRKKRFYLCTT